MVRSMDLREVALYDGALSAEVATDKAIFSSLKNIGLNLAALPNDFIHTMQASVIAEVKVRE